MMSGQQSATFESGSQKYAIDRYANTGGAGKRPVVVLFHLSEALMSICT